MKIRRTLLLLPLALLACGYQPPNLVVIGNSITLSHPRPDLDWTGDWGMAASAQDKDFAHQTAAALHLPVTVFNLATLERLEPTAPADEAAAIAAVNGGSTVVVELGDNAGLSDPERFRQAYNLLLASVRRRRALYCVSTFWERAWLDQIVQRGCQAYGGTYVYIGDILNSPPNPDFQSVLFTNPGVQGHPHDWSMQQIAARIIEAATEPK